MVPDETIQSDSLLLAPPNPHHWSRSRFQSLSYFSYYTWHSLWLSYSLCYFCQLAHCLVPHKHWINIGEWMNMSINGWLSDHLSTDCLPHALTPKAEKGCTFSSTLMPQEKVSLLVYTVHPPEDSTISPGISRKQGEDFAVERDTNSIKITGLLWYLN